ncbi:hypothetical protein BHE74_00029497, partial [Ensete ventricosum]
MVQLGVATTTSDEATVRVGSNGSGSLRGRQGEMEKITMGSTVGSGKERKMGTTVATWLGGSNKMRLQDDEGGSWTALEMKGGGWAAAFGHMTGMKKGVAIRRARVEQSRGEVWSGRKRKQGSNGVRRAAGSDENEKAGEQEGGCRDVTRWVTATRATERPTSRRHQQRGEEEGATEMAATTKWWVLESIGTKEGGGGGVELVQ